MDTFNSPQSGGNILNEIRNLAVPFGILLSFKGYESYIQRAVLGASASKASKASKPRKTTQKGGCAPCAGILAGGGKEQFMANTIAVQHEFNRLVNELKNMI